MVSLSQHLASILTAEFAVPAAAQNAPALRQPQLPAVLPPAAPADTRSAWERATDAERALALERVAFVRACCEVRGAVGCSWEEAVRQVAAGRAAEFPLLRRAGHHGASALTYANLRQWRRRLGTDAAGRLPAYDARERLLDAYARGHRSVVDQEHPLVQLVAKYYLNQNRLQLSEAYRLAAAEARARRLDHPELQLSRHQVARFFGRPELRQAIFLARHGVEEYRQRYMDWIERDWSEVAVGACLVQDHHRFDAAVRMADGDGWRAVRPWLTACMCNRSLYFAGWFIETGDPNTVSCENALLLAIRNMGNVPPTWIYADNGKDYQARGFVAPVTVALEDGREVEYSVARSLNIQVVTAIAYNARAKVIERMFREVADKFSRYWFGYLGNRPGNRPWNGEEAWERPETLPSLQEFCEAFAWWVQEHYHRYAGAASKITGGRAPAELWEARKAEREALSDADLARAFLRPLMRSSRQALFRVGRGGRIQLNGRSYQDPALWPWIERDVLVKVSCAPGDEALYVFEPGGAYIARVGEKQTTPAIAQGDDGRALVSMGMRAKERQLVQARTVLREIAGEKNVTHRVTPVIDRLQVAGVLGAVEATEIPAAVPEPDQATEPRAATRSGRADAELLERLLAGRAVAESAPDVAGARETDRQLLDAIMRGE